MKDLRDELDAHRRDAYAHSQMMGRVMQENIALRERFENRLNALERFRAQATIVGGIGLIILGAVAAAVAERVFGFHVGA